MRKRSSSIYDQVSTPTDIPTFDLISKIIAACPIQTDEFQIEIHLVVVQDLYGYLLLE